MYYTFQYTLETGGNVSTVISRNKEELEKESKKQANYVSGDGTVGQIEEMDVDWVSVNSEYEPVNVVGIGDNGRTYYYYITKAKEAHVFISTSKAELEDEVEKMKESSDVEVIQDLTEVEGKSVSIENEYQPYIK